MYRALTYQTCANRVLLGMVWHGVAARRTLTGGASYSHDWPYSLQEMAAINSCLSSDTAGRKNKMYSGTYTHRDRDKHTDLDVRLAVKPDGADR